MRYFSGFCMFRDHICVVRHGGQPFQYNLGAGVDVRGQTHVPARHFSLQSAYQSAGPGHSGGQRSKCPVMWLFLIHRSCLNDITGWFMKFGAKRTNPVVGTEIQFKFWHWVSTIQATTPQPGPLSSQNKTGGFPFSAEQYTFSFSFYAYGYICGWPRPVLAETSQQPISQTTWQKVTPHCNHCNHYAQYK